MPESTTNRRRCRFCRRTFTPAHALERFCGDGCRWAATRGNMRKAADRMRGLTGPLDLRARYIPSDDGQRYQDAYFEALMADPCCYCTGSSDTFDHITFDHITPHGAETDNTWANLTAACKSCNSSKQRTPLLRWLLAGAITTDLQPQLETIERLTGANLRNPRAAAESPRVVARLRRRTTRSRAR